MKDNSLGDLVRQDPERWAQLQEHLRSKAPLFGSDSPFSSLLQDLVNTALEGELDHYLDATAAATTEATTAAAAAAAAAGSRKNKRNGHTKKTISSSAGPLQIATPRDRQGQFEPQLVAKRQRQLGSGIDDQILALYAQGNSVEDVRRLIEQLYGVQLAAGKISAITDRVLPEIQAWQQRRLLPFYPLVYLDAIHFKVRHEGRYVQRAFYTVYSVDFEGQRDLLGLYVQDQEGAHLWGLVLEDLQRRGVEDILIICTDNLTGFSQAIEHVFPQAIVQKCIVHQMRNSLRFVDEKDRRAVVQGLQSIYQAATLQQARQALDVFTQQWGKKYAYIVQQWERGWEELMAFMNFSGPLRRMIYTTNPVEALHRIVRKLVKSKAAWVSDQALIKQLYLSLMANEKSWRRRAYNWKVIQRELLAAYPERVGRAMDGGGSGRGGANSSSKPSR